ncbi:MAG: 3-dehydroquinate synthase [Spirochaetes bacterium RBG_13_51_14]|nr:MAG: 3-dehydroquinate synthase [Spirochaetes bacterium RBG_13_51_14]
MKEVWLHLVKWDKKLVTESLESGVDAIMTAPELIPKIRELGRMAVIAPEAGDRKMPDDVEIVIIKNKDDEKRAAELLKSKAVVVRTTDWDIIPIENLIPQGGDRLYTFVRNLDDTRTAAGILEKGVAGVVLETDEPGEISKVVKYIKEIDSETYGMAVLEIIGIKNIGIGDRVCVDTCSNINMGEGLLVGNASQGMFLVHAENIDNPYVAPRPFRINAGAVHSYVRVPGGTTRYLGELQTGDPVLIVNKDGRTYTSYVGRSKIEKRPMLVVYAADGAGNTCSVILQNAETIRLTAPDGKAVSVAELKVGDRVLGYIEKGGRHFGMAVEETIKEQ